MADLSTWWDGLTSIQSIFWLIAIPSTLVFLVLMILTLFGGDADGDVGDVDADIDADTGIGFQFFTLKSLIGFFAVFSWSGISCQEAGMGMLPTLLISIFSGAAMMTIMAGIFYMLNKMQDSGTLNIHNAINGIGEVYLTVTAKRGSIGKVHIKIQGALRELDALTDDEQDLTRGDVIQVLNVVNDQMLLVTKSKI